MKFASFVAWAAVILAAPSVLAANSTSTSSKNSTGATYPTKSGIEIWVDPDTPEDRRSFVSSRGRQWDLVMSDEFNMKNRSFRPGDDHLWTSLDKPDGVNGALEIYSHNMTGTKCDGDDCYFFIEVKDEVNVVHVYNMYTNPPGYQDVNFYYRAAMVQSWNKFCYQGGLLEVRAQLPGAVTKESGNPDLPLGASGKVLTSRFYPTWPGKEYSTVFARFRSVTYTCTSHFLQPEVFNPDNQRISACNDNPGYGMHPNQGRGAPEIDILEGGGLAISSSLQIAPGMPEDYRLFRADPDGADAANSYCVYTYDCKTPGANMVDVPTAYYQKERGHRSWYQGLRYGANNFCAQNATAKQDYDTVAASVKAGIKENTCTAKTCPASEDVNSDLSFMDDSKKNHWSINSNGTCFPIMNSYTGAYLCDPDNTDSHCLHPRNSTTPKTNSMSSFNYQMDAISSNWPIHLGAYTDYVVYQVEWVTGENGYVRWMLDGSPIFEVTTDAFSNVPQSTKKDNPKKVMLEEPMYLIFNVALSSSWGTTPPNAGRECRGDGNDPVANAICDSFPMYMKIDYIRLYQDKGDDLEADNYMHVGCDPETHPTKKWIDAHVDEYVDDDNPWKEVSGKAFCKVDNDCTIGGNVGTTALKTGKCVKGRCQCTYATSWGGPRCTTALAGSTSTSASSLSSRAYGPPMGLSMVLAGIIVFLSFVSVYLSMLSAKKQAAALSKSSAQAKMAASMMDEGQNNSTNQRPKDNYSQNFV
ncbi:unnamed protein product [Phytophthora fragariaefolia]|uniref:Unnamed protein product n=1 Tax=Phytophthora fragariaefolia TaxID=1490495 RepID=A0A9W6XCD3_9STRA|nr:unnamed protein product [Phytophthora fragariaefolia]